MARSNTLVFCMVVLAMTATYCTGRSRQQENADIYHPMERQLTKREFQDQLFGEVGASLRLPRAVPVRRPIDEPVPEVENPPVPKKHNPTVKQPDPCPCPCGPDSYTACPKGCRYDCLACPCPCGYRGYVACPMGCRPYNICNGR